MLKAKKIMLVLNNKKNIYILLISYCVAILLGTIVCYESYLSYQNDIERAFTQTQNMTAVMNRELALLIERIDFSLDDIQEQVEREKWEISSKNTEVFNKYLALEKNKKADVLSFKIINKNGDLVGDNAGFSEKINYRDREYFQKLKNVNKNILIISQPVMSKTLKRWVLVLARPVQDQKGKFNGVVIGTVDVNLIKRLFSNVDVGKYGSIVLASKNFIQLVRFPWDEKIIGQPFPSQSYVQSFLNSNNQKASATLISPIDGLKKAVTLEKAQDGQLFLLVSLSYKEILANWYARTIMYVLFLIIIFIAFFILLIQFLYSVEKFYQEQRNNLHNSKLAALGQMTDGIAHEINNPLSIMTGQMAMIEKLVKVNNLPNQERILNYLDKTNATIFRIARIIQGISTFSRSTLDMKPGPTSLSLLLTKLQSSLDEKFKYENIQLSITCPSDLQIECVDAQIEQVFFNLLINSFDAIKTLNEKWIKIKVIIVNEKIQITFQDSGRGIPIEIQDKMMLPFFTTKEVGSGTGLGMSISHGIVNSHKGRLYLDHLNPNTTFIIELPLKTYQ